LQVDDVDIVALAVDVLLHLGVPAARLMPEVYSRFEQVFHAYVWQMNFLLCFLEPLHMCMGARPPPASFPLRNPDTGSLWAHIMWAHMMWQTNQYLLPDTAEKISAGVC